MVKVKVEPPERTFRVLPQINHDIHRILTEIEGYGRRRDVALPPMIDRMSSAGRCYRERWAAFRGLPLDPGKGFSSDILAILRMGNPIEEEVVALLNQTPGYSVDNQQLEVGKPPWVGHIDGLLTWGHPNRSTRFTSLLEVKSANRERWEEVTKLGYEAWNPSYAAQLQAYMAHLPEGIEDAVVCVYNKDTSQMHWENIPYDKVEALRLFAMSTKVTDLSNSMPPERPPQATSHACKYCKWCDRAVWCWDPNTDAKFAP